MCMKQSLRATFVILAACGTAIGTSGCQSSRIGNLPKLSDVRLSQMPGLKWMGRLRGDQPKKELADTTSSTLPSTSTNPSPTTSATPNNSWVSTQPPQNQPNGSYPTTAQANAGYGVNTAGGYYTGPYNTSSATASYTGTVPGSSPGPQNGFYSTAPGPQPPVNQQGVYTADTRSATSTPPYRASADPYNPNPNYGTYAPNSYGAAGAPTGSGYSSPTHRNVSGTTEGSLGQGIPESRYTAPSHNGQNATNPANNSYGVPSNTPPTTSASLSGPAHSVYGQVPSPGSQPAYGQVPSPGSQPVSGTYPSTTPYGQPSSSYGTTSNANTSQSNAATVVSPALTDNRPWRPGSTSNYQPAATPNGTANGNVVMPANYSSSQLPGGSTYKPAPSQAATPYTPTGPNTN